MSCYRGVFRADSLNMNVHMTFCLPDYEPPRATLILLHGLSGGCDDWLRFTSIERYARDHALAVFMPEVQRSWYIDMKYGLNYFTFVSEELPRYIAETFRVPTDPGRLYIAGLSMGGFGALKTALTHPDRFAGCVALSSRFYLDHKLEGLTDPSQRGEWVALLGEDCLLGPENDLEQLAKAAVAAGPIPRLYLACGTEDSLYPETVRMHEYLKGLGCEVAYGEWSGVHDWAFWDKGIREGLAAVVRA